jgi:hypothetical protein
VGVCVFSVITVSAWAGFENGSRSSTQRSDSSERAVEDSLVIPGSRAGVLALGDPTTKISELFPKPSFGQPSTSPSCGAEYVIGLLQDASHPGFLRAFAKDQKIVEVEAYRELVFTHPKG